MPDLTCKPRLPIILTVLTTMTTLTGGMTSLTEGMVGAVRVVNEDIAFPKRSVVAVGRGCPACRRLSGGWHWGWRGL